MNEILGDLDQAPATERGLRRSGARIVLAGVPQLSLDARVAHERGRGLDGKVTPPPLQGRRSAHSAAPQTLVLCLSALVGVVDGYQFSVIVLVN